MILDCSMVPWGSGWFFLNSTFQLCVVLGFSCEVAWGWSDPRKTKCWCFPCHDRIWKSRHSQVGQREIWEGGWILHFYAETWAFYWTLLLWHGWEKPEQLILKMHVKHNSEIALFLQFVWTCHAVLICFESPGTLTSTESTVNLNLRATLCSSCAMAEPPTVVDNRYFFTHISLGVWPSALKTNLTTHWCLPGDTSAQHVPSRIKMIDWYGQKTPLSINYC